MNNTRIGDCGIGKSYYTHELNRLESNHKFLKKLVLVIAVVGTALMNIFTGYGIIYLLDVMTHHPEPFKQWIGIFMFSGITVAINILTILYYFSMRIENSEKETDRD